MQKYPSSAKAIPLFACRSAIGCSLKGKIRIAWLRVGGSLAAKIISIFPWYSDP